MFTNLFTSLSLAATLAISSVQAANTIKAYSNYDCTDQLEIPSIVTTVATPSQVDILSRYIFKNYTGSISVAKLRLTYFRVIQPSGKNDCIQYYTGSGCTGSKIPVFTLNNQCLKVDTGGPVQSFRCKQNSVWCSDV
uniref:Uncharacterized protein n=1 Tax=Psilocybe cubensis TaxID=181762 RepID=A0A8H7Y781_PSICU